MHSEFNTPNTNFLIENIDFVSVKRDKNYRHSYKNGRSKHGFIYILKGKMRDEFMGEDITSLELKAGDLIFIPKGCSYFGNYLEDDTEIRIIQFDILNKQLPQYLLRPIKIDYFGEGDEFLTIFDSKNNEHPFFNLSCIYRLLWQIDKMHQGIPKKYRKLKTALKELKEHFYENMPISYYAELCDMSEVNFRRLFKEYTSKTPIEYRNELRLEAARARILSGEYNISEASESCGFSNLSFFIRLYKRKYGHTPKTE